MAIANAAMLDINNVRILMQPLQEMLLDGVAPTKSLDGRTTRLADYSFDDTRDVPLESFHM